MRKFIIFVCIISMFVNIPVLAEGTAPAQIDKDIDNMLNPENAPQQNGSDIQPDKVYSVGEYDQIYRELEVPKFQFIHGIDPDQYYDLKDTAWSPYPLIRLNSPIYFKSITVEPGYYLLTPRQYKGDWYVLFKESGKVKYIIPVFERNYTDMAYYHDNLKELDMKTSQKWMIKFLNGFGKIFKKSKRQPAIKTNLELTDIDNKYVLIEIFFGTHRYKTIFKTEKF